MVWVKLSLYVHEKFTYSRTFVLGPTFGKVKHVIFSRRGKKQVRQSVKGRRKPDSGHDDFYLVTH